MRNHPLILIADDQPMLRQMLRDALASEGYEFIEASTGHQAIDLFRQHKPDIVLLDVIMPGIDGPNACAALRALPEGHTVPILMITGRDDDQTINIAFAACADDYITKPCNMLVLRHRVKRLLEAERHRKVIEQMAMIDGLTGLLNRRMLTQKLTQAMRNSRDSKKPLSLILLDIDHFKKINDTYGHTSGDQVLRTLSALLQKEVGKQGFVGRYGGEEFIIVLPDTVVHAAFSVASRVLAKLQKLPIVVADAPQPLFITASLGVTQLRYQPPDTFDEFVKRADEAMYEAKTQGRCRVCQG